MFEDLIKLSKLFYKLASNQDIIEKYLPLLIEMKSDHPKFQEIKSKVISALKTEDGQNAFNYVGELALAGSLENYHGTSVLSAEKAKDIIFDLINYLNDENKETVIRYLKPEQMKKFINDPNPKIRSIVYDILGIEDLEEKINQLDNPTRAEKFFFRGEDDKRIQNKLREIKYLITVDNFEKILKYFDSPTDNTYMIYDQIFKDYIKSIEPLEATMILEKYPNLNPSWQNVLKRKIGLPVNVPSLKEVIKSLKETKSPDKKLN